MRRWFLILILLLAMVFAACGISRAVTVIGATSPGACWNTGANGWTTICSAPITSGTCSAGTANGTCKYYVSSSGSNTANDCLNSASPCQTLAYGVGKLRADKPDWLLLKKGDTWTDEDFRTWTTSGLSATAPVLLSSYDPANPTVPDPGTGGARPLVKTKTNPVFGMTTEGNYMAVIGIEFQCYDRTGPSNPGYDVGFYSRTGAGNWIMFEDNKISYYTSGITLQAIHPDTNQKIIVRRNVIAFQYSFNASANSTGFFIDGFQNLTLEENIFHHNGWSEVISSGGANPLNHNVYVNGRAQDVAGSYFNGPAVVNGNILTRDPSGNHFRSGGQVYNNFFAQSPSVFNFGMPIGGYQNNVYNNVCSEGTQGATPGWGFATFARYQGFAYDSAPLLVTNNIVSNTLVNPASSNFAIAVDGTGNTTVTGNTIWNWGNYPNLISDQATGRVLTLGALTGGTGYVNGSYSQVPLTGNSPSVGAFANITVSGSSVTVVTLVDPNNSTAFGGVGYHVADSLSASNANLGGSGSGFSVPVATILSSVVTTPNNVNCTTCYLGGAYPDPSRTIGSYAGTLSLTATLDGFMAQALLQSKDNWNAALTASAVNTYIRAGFGI